MSLREAYTLAHTAQCRLNIEASRPDRNLRLVVGHLLHYESLRLRIVEIEHDISQSRRAKQATIDYTLQHKPTGQAGQKPQPSPLQSYSTSNDYDDDDDDELVDDDDAGEDLALSRYPSGASRPQPPELEPDDSEEDDYDDDFLIDYSHLDSDRDTLERAVKGEESELMASMYEDVRRCPCHGETDAPKFERMWELPPDQNHSKEGFTRAVGQVSDDNLKSKPHPAADLAQGISIAAVA